MTDAEMRLADAHHLARCRRILGARRVRIRGVRSGEMGTFPDIPHFNADQPCFDRLGPMVPEIQQATPA